MMPMLRPMLPSDEHLLGALSILQVVLYSGTKVSVVRRDWARPWLKTTTHPTGAQ